MVKTGLTLAFVVALSFVAGCQQQATDDVSVTQSGLVAGEPMCGMGLPKPGTYYGQPLSGMIVATRSPNYNKWYVLVVDTTAYKVSNVFEVGPAELGTMTTNSAAQNQAVLAGVHVAPVPIGPNPKPLQGNEDWYAALAIDMALRYGEVPKLASSTADKCLPPPSPVVK